MPTRNHIIMDYVQLFVLAICAILSVSGWDSVMDERFAVYFHTLNENGDDVVSLDDVTTCVGRAAEEQQNIVVKVKCEEFLPRWYIHCIMGGHDGLSEPDFVNRFRDIESEKGKEAFSQVMFRCAQVGYRIIDLNSDGVVSSDEDRCMSVPTPTETAARDLTTYLMNDTPDNYVANDASCPWRGASSSQSE
ncbi:uncharacterized protein LOC121371952 [Gigantopelta aegis]|uniref:uncharacterized protein LOC121371952 n=1 Tax=Gigantopelta aegis TaxID=1735272 RepID=UPI001B88DD39|nr:uncharacterized protein LOC121371952 [Gigantopelta aegis]